jgi:hypothetical protein
MLVIFFGSLALCFAGGALAMNAREDGGRRRGDTGDLIGNPVGFVLEGVGGWTDCELRLEVEGRFSAEAPEGGLITETRRRELMAMAC